MAVPSFLCLAMELASLPVLLQPLLRQTIGEIYLVDFEEEPEQDLYSPWQLIVVFQEGDQVLMVED